MPHDKWQRFAELAKLLAPTILVAVRPELAPIAVKISNAISEAELIKGSSGPDKLKHVLAVADAAADVYNATNGPDINKSALHDAVTAGVNVVVAATNLVVKPAAVPLTTPTAIGTTPPAVHVVPKSVVK